MDTSASPKDKAALPLRLHILPAEGAPFDFVLEAESVIIGRSSSAGLTLVDRSLSRQHSRIFRDKGQTLIEDLGSRNGTLLNGKPVDAPTPIRPGDAIRISGSLLSVIPAEPPMVDTPHSESGSHTIFRRASELLASSPETPTGAGSLAVSRYAARLRILHEVHLALGRPMELTDLLELILDRAFDHLRPERAAIFLKTPQGELVSAARRSAPGATAEIRPSSHLAAEVIDKGLAAIVLDAQTDERFAAAMSIQRMGVRSLIAAPLSTPDGALGMITLDSNLAVRQFQEEDLELLVGLAAVAALRIRNVALTEEAVERKRMEEELALARRIQVALLPSTIPDIPGYEIQGANIPSRGVSGDYYEVIERLDGRECVLLIADVSGKGVAASLLTASLEALAATPIEEGQPPDEIFIRLSRQLFRRTPPEKFATVFAAMLDIESGRIRYANAGHNPPLVVRAKTGTIERLGPTGPPIGLFPSSVYQAADVSLEPGDLLVLYTDGIVEAVNPEEEEYSIERLEKACLENGRRPLPEMMQALEADLAAFVGAVPYPDDRTVLLARRRRA
jgi:serine phosphatase RsbU (regulator of sigma subunit)/pSer/pThr/pTyr-binding forkhead associated (FHA) protein